MKVFVSWSGDLSNKVAIILKGWVPNILQSVELYVSSEDIEKGSRWNEEITRQLALSDYGILCVTKDNTEAPWLNFEAGALSNKLGLSKVCPFLYGIEFSEVAEPLRQFQAVTFTRKDVLGLIRSINNSCGDNKLDSARLDLVFDIMWKHLSEEFSKIQSDDFDRSFSAKADMNLKVLNAKSSIKKALLEFSSDFKTYDENQLNSRKIVDPRLETYSSSFLRVTNDAYDILPKRLTEDLYACVSEMKSLVSEPKLINNSKFMDRLKSLLRNVDLMYERFDGYFV